MYQWKINGKPHWWADTKRFSSKQLNTKGAQIWQFDRFLNLCLPTAKFPHNKRHSVISCRFMKEIFYLHLSSLLTFARSPSLHHTIGAKNLLLKFDALRMVHCSYSWWHSLLANNDSSAIRFFMKDAE